MKYIITICLLANLIATTNLQSQTVKVDSTFANYGDTVLVPLEFYGYLNMGALTLFIEYDTLALKYVGMTNLIPEGQGTLTNATIIQDSITVVGIAWSANNGGINFPDGKYLDLKFVFMSSESDLKFYEPMCEIVDWDVNIILSTYIDGGVYYLSDIKGASKNTQNQIYAYSNMLVLDVKELSMATVQLYDLLGKLIFNSEVEVGMGRKEIELSQIPSGYYLTKTILNNETLTNKIFINND